MKTYTTKELNANVYAYILDAIDKYNYDEFQLKNDTEKLNHLAERFKAEFLKYNLNIKGKSYQTLLAEWYSGLPIHIACYNSEIIEIAKLWKSISENATESEEDKIINNWFNFLAAKTMQLFNKHKITSFYL